MVEKLSLATDCTGTPGIDYQHFNTRSYTHSYTLSIFMMTSRTDLPGSGVTTRSRSNYEGTPPLSATAEAGRRGPANRPTSLPHPDSAEINELIAVAVMEATRSSERRVTEQVEAAMASQNEKLSAALAAIAALTASLNERRAEPTTPVVTPPRARPWSEDDNDDSVSTASTTSCVDLKELPKLDGNSPDGLETWIQRIKMLKAVHGYTDEAMRRSLPGLIKENSPAATWFNTLEAEDVVSWSWTAWLDAIVEEFGDPNRSSALRAAYADCTPTSGKYKNFLDFTDDKLRLRAKAFGSDQNSLLPLSACIENLIALLPPEGSAIARLMTFTTVTSFRTWLRTFLESPRNREIDPCAVAFKRRARPTGGQPHSTVSTTSNVERTAARQPSGKHGNHSGSSATSTGEKPLPDGNKEPPGPCRWCQGAHWSIYCWQNERRKDPPADKTGKYGKPKPNNSTPSSSTRTYFETQGSQSFESPSEFHIYSDEGFCPIGAFF